MRKNIQKIRQPRVLLHGLFSNLQANDGLVVGLPVFEEGVHEVGGGRHLLFGRDYLVEGVLDGIAGKYGNSLEEVGLGASAAAKQG